YQSKPLISTWNMKGSNNVVKRKSVLNSLKKDTIQIGFLQETHLSDDEHNGGQFFFSSHSATKRGVITLIHKNPPFTVTSCCKDTEGRYILVKGIMHSENILLANMYCPNMIIGDQATLLESTISQLEIDKAISTLQSGKCPGEDGFPSSQYNINS
uniref:Endonuclease/exonuclease/phosphatase domain-containing protein n=1 Tax=Echeneis naucrates TaxID=173247 RepID=A0A665U703_ECHNA